MRTPQIVNTVEVISELWVPVGVLIQQGEGNFALRLVLRDGWPPACGQATRVDAGKVVHVPVWYGMPWHPSPPAGIPIDQITAPEPGGRRVGLRRPFPSRPRIQGDER